MAKSKKGKGNDTAARKAAQSQRVDNGMRRVKYMNGRGQVRLRWMTEEGVLV